MRVIEVTSYGEPDVLRLADRPEPAAAPGRVRVQMAATTVNPVDWFTRTGAMAAVTPDLAFPFVLGFDIAGTVLEDEAGFTAGQRVVGVYPWLQEGTGHGTYAEVVLADPSWLVPLPDGIAFADAATLPLNALTALQALDLLELSSGDSVLVSGASGAVGSFAVQLAAGRGLHVLAAASTGDEAWVSGLGAKEVLPRSTPDALAEQVRALLPDGVDGVLDAALLGQPLVAAVRDAGTFVTVLQPAAPDGERGIQVQAVQARPDAAQLQELVSQVARGELATRVAEVLPLQDAAEAHRRAQAGGVRGKLVLSL